MLVKTKVIGDETHSYYESSTIVKSIYNKEKQTLIIVFNKRAQYMYNGVSNTEYMLFETADSQGVELRKSIIKKDTVKLDAPDLDAIHQELLDIIEVENTNFKLLIIEKCKSISGLSENDPNFDATCIDLYKTIDFYNKKKGLN